MYGAELSWRPGYYGAELSWRPGYLASGVRPAPRRGGLVTLIPA